jgi:hypothetical protein
VIVSRKLALIIGNSQYEDKTLARLVTPDADVNALAEVLRDPEIGGFDQVTALVDQPSTTVRRAISSFFVEKGRDDLLVLYFSGHGIRDDRGQLFLAVKDTEHKLLRGTAIPATFITEEMDNSYSKRQVLILDCCHSGAFTEGMKGAPGLSVGTASAFEGTGFGRAVLTATDSTQYAWEGDQVTGQAENSVFTQYIIQGLRTGVADTDGDGRITLDELYDYVYEQVVNDTPKQTPSKWSYGQQGEIVIARNPNPVVKPVELPMDLQQTIDDPRPWVREGAVRELDRLVREGYPGLAFAASEALKRLTDDDSRRVASMAGESLAAYAGIQHSIEGTVAQAEPAEVSEWGKQAGRVSQPVEARPGKRFQLGEWVQRKGKAAIFERAVWKQVLLITVGWAIGGLVGGYLGGNSGEIAAVSAIGGVIGGLVTGLVIHTPELPSRWKGTLVITAGWAIGWLINSTISNAISHNLGDAFANSFYVTIGMSWDSASILGTAAGGAIGGAAGGAIGGISIGLVLRQAKLSLHPRQILRITLGWALIWGIGAGIFWFSGETNQWDSLGFAAISLAVCLAISGAIGSFLMLSQLRRSEQPA